MTLFFVHASIYFHQLYGSMDTMLFQCSDQINGTNAHRAIDKATYSTHSEVLQGLPVYCAEYNIQGKIDIFDAEKGILTERKKKIVRLYDGYYFQLYAQCLSLREMGYSVKIIRFYSKDDNKLYPVALPEDNPEMFDKFKKTVFNIQTFDIVNFKQTNAEKCRHCIYEPACDRSLL